MWHLVAIDIEPRSEVGSFRCRELHISRSFLSAHAHTKRIIKSRFILKTYSKTLPFILFVKIINPIDEKVELVNCEWKKKEKEKEGAEIFNCEIDPLAVLGFSLFRDKRRSGLLLDETYFGKEMVFSWDYFVEICNIISGEICVTYDLRGFSSFPFSLYCYLYNSYN